MAQAKVSQSQLNPKSDQQPLGELLAAVLNHPDVPGKVYDGIVDGLSTLQRNEVVDSPEFIQMLLELDKKYPAKKHDGGTSCDLTRREEEDVISAVRELLACRCDATRQALVTTVECLRKYVCKEGLLTLTADE